jgi:8-oxo-dGTP pyrophosphatase MutT (NUDIX family)
MGAILFYLLWPLVWLYAPLFRRVRVVLSHADEVILVKNFFGPGIWQFPGGGIKFGESVQEAAIREIQEELGIDIHTQKIKVLHSDIRIVQQFGLLMRYHFVYVELDTKIEISKSREVTCAEWVKTSTQQRISKEVYTGLQLVSQQG